MAINRRPLDEIVKFFGPAKSAAMIAKVPATLDAHMALIERTPGDAIGPLAHKLKGLAAMYGLDELAAAALRLERDEVVAAELPAALNQLGALVCVAKKELQAFVSELGRVGGSGAA